VVWPQFQIGNLVPHFPQSTRKRMGTLPYGEILNTVPQPP